MRGTRDSEIAAILRDLETVDSTMNGVAVRVCSQNNAKLWLLKVSIYEGREICTFTEDEVVESTFGHF